MSDRVFGVCIIALAAFFAFSAFQIRESFLQDPVGPRSFPLLVAGVAALCGAVMVLRPDPDPDWPGPLTFGNLAAATLVMVAYAYSLKPLGFLIPTAIAAGILSWQIGRRPVFAAAAGLGLSIGLFVLFRYALGLSLVPFPKDWM